MRRLSKIILYLLFCVIIVFPVSAKDNIILFCGSKENDLYKVLSHQGFNLKHYLSQEEAVHDAMNGDVLIVMADKYPFETSIIKESLIEKANQKGIKFYLEYPSAYPGLEIEDEIFVSTLERIVVTEAHFMDRLQPMQIMGVNDCHVVKFKNIQNPFLIIGKIAGLNKAEFGINDIKKYPILFNKGNALIATTKLSNFISGRYAPERMWRDLWESIVSWLMEENVDDFECWKGDVSPTYSRLAKLPKNAKKNSIKSGTEWFWNANFFLHEEWLDIFNKYQGNGKMPFGPPIGLNMKNGDGSLGILEGHASKINHDGSQQYRYWIRADVQAEVAYAIAAAAHYLNDKNMSVYASNLLDFLYVNSNLRSGKRNQMGDPNYGLISWAVTHPSAYYGDDNARAVLGTIGAAAYLNNEKWNDYIVEAILANYRTTGLNGFRGNLLWEKEITQNGLKYYANNQIVNPHAHFESWLWACYLWLYNQTDYKPLLEKAKKGIRIMMEKFNTDEWKWTNGIQQERARMVLPLAWLVRVEDTEENRRWLDMVVQEILKDQDSTGAIKEEIGNPETGRYKGPASNHEYGENEAPLIFSNEDNLADMLYTSNFAYFALNEAAQATGNKQYQNAVYQLEDFLIRIQAKSDNHKDLSGAWYRAFDYENWEYWGSNADIGWGPWGTLTGWTQSWILSTLILTSNKHSYWDLTNKLDVSKTFQKSMWMLN